MNWLVCGKSLHRHLVSDINKIIYWLQKSQEKNQNENFQIVSGRLKKKKNSRDYTLNSHARSTVSVRGALTKSSQQEIEETKAEAGEKQAGTPFARNRTEEAAELP